MMKKVLVTGGAGFIGSHLINKLLDKNYDVSIIKREETNIWRIKDIMDKIIVYDADLRDTHRIAEVIAECKPDIICHLATIYAVNHQRNDMTPMIDTNVLGTINLLDASVDSSVNLFINTSTCSVYGASMEKLKENSIINPSNLYSVTKVQAEQACDYYSKNHDIKAITLRLFPPYGPKDNARKLIPYIINSISEGKSPKMTTGMQKWDFVYVDDIVEAYIRSLSARMQNMHEIINIGTGTAISIRDITSKIIELLGSGIEPKWGAIEHRGNEIWFNCADNNKAREILKWHPRTSALENGLKLTIESCRGHS